MKNNKSKIKKPKQTNKTNKLGINQTTKNETATKTTNKNEQQTKKKRTN